jgi:hypothetical protein
MSGADQQVGRGLESAIRIRAKISATTRSGFHDTVG